MPNGSNGRQVVSAEPEVLFISLHALVPGEWSVKEAHDWVERIERDLRDAIPNCHITSHLEPIDDPCSMEDQELDRITPV